MTYPSRRAVLRDRLLPAALGTVALAAGIRPGRALAPEPSARPFVSLTDFGITGRAATDVSTAFQAAIDAAGRDGGGKVVCPPGLIWAKGLVVPNNVTIEGAGVGATTIKLPDGANTDLIQQSGYAENKTWGGSYIGLRDLTLDGNKTTNRHGNLIVLRGWRGLIERVKITRSPEHGILFSAGSADGTSNPNGMAENAAIGCFVSECEGAGLYARNDGGQRIADMLVYDCTFHRNGSAGFYQIDLERSAGFQIRSNKMYNGFRGDIRALGAGGLIIALNNCEGTGNHPENGIARQIYIEMSGWGHAIITGNLLHIHTKQAYDVRSWRQIEILANSVTAALVSSNSLSSEFEGETRPIYVNGPSKAAIVIQGNAISRKGPAPD